MKKTAVISLLMAFCMMLSIFGGTFTTAFADNYYTAGEDETVIEFGGELNEEEDGQEEESLEEFSDDPIDGDDSGDLDLAVEDIEGGADGNGSSPITTFGGGITPFALDFDLYDSVINNHLLISWEKVAGAASYGVYRAFDDAGPHELITYEDDTGEDTIYFIDPFLIDNTYYSYVVKAFDETNGGGSIIAESKVHGASSEGFYNVIDMSIVEVKSNSVRVKWTASSSEYALFMTTDPACLYYEYVDTTSDLEYTFTGLDPEMTYYFGVMPIDSGAADPYSLTGPMRATTFADPVPADVQSLTANTVDHQSIQLTWTAALGATSYRVDWSDGVNSGSFDTLDVTTALHEGLDSDTTYTYVVYGVNDAGVSANPSPEASAKTKIGPTTLTATPEGRYSIKLDWAEVPNVTHYTIYSVDGINITQVHEVPAGTLTWTQTGLTSDTDYTYVVIARRDDEKGVPSNEATARTQGDLPIPTSVDAEAETSTSIKVTWDAVPGYTDYIVYVCDTEDGTYVEVDQVTGTELIHNGLDANTDYYYKVAVVDTEGAGEKSDWDMATTKLDAPTGLIVDEVTDTSVTLSWDDLPGADQGYVIYRSDDENGPFVEVGTSPTPDFIDQPLDPETKYFYTVAGKTKDQVGDQCDPVEAVTKIERPTNVQAEGKTSTTIEVTWDEVVDATGYKIYRSLTEYGNYEPAGSVDAPNLTFTDTGRTPETVYYYVVTAMKGTDEGQNSDPANAKTKIAPPVNVHTETKGPNAIDVLWDDDPAADEYVIYRGDDQDGPFTEIGRSDDPSYSDTGLAPDTDYWYQVAIVKSGEEGEPSAPVLGTTSLEKVQNLRATAQDSQSILVEWDEKLDADGYVIYRSLTVDGTYEKIGDSSDPEYLDEGLNASTRYFYKVAAKKGNVPGEQAGPVDDKTLPKKIENVEAEPDEDNNVIVTWDPDPEVDEYYVYRSEDPDGPFDVPIGEATGPEYIDTDAEDDTKYFYVVKGKDKETGEPGDPSDPAEVITRLPATDLDAEAIDDQSIELTWDEIPNADEYIIYRSEDPAGPWDDTTLVDTVPATETDYLDEGLTPNTKYFYVIRGVRDDLPGLLSPVADATTLLDSATDVEAEPIDDESIKVTWTQKPGADGYEVYVSEDPDGPWDDSTKVGTVPGTDTELDVDGLNPDTEYYVVVKPIDEDGKAGMPNDPPADVRTLLPATDLIEAEPVDDTKIEVTWDPIPNADEYELEIAIDPNGPWTPVTTTPDTDYVVDGLDPNTKYFFRVKGKNPDNTGVPSDIADATTMLTAPIDVDAEAMGPDSIKVTWKQVPGATQYIVARADDESGPYAVVGTVNADPGSPTLELLDDNGLVPNEWYYYIVTAISPDNSSNPSDPPAAAKTFVPAPTDISAKAIDHQSIQVDWTAVTDADGYYVYRSLTEDGLYEKIGETPTNQYIDTNLDANTTYYYKVAAHSMGNTSELSDWASARTSNAPYTLKTPHCISVCSTKPETIRIKHASIKGAVGYNYYRSESKYGPFEYIGSSLLPIYYDEGLIPYTYYYYKVEAYHDYGISKMSSVRYTRTKNINPMHYLHALKAKKVDAYTIELDWAKCVHAVGYSVYRLDPATGDYELIAMTTDHEYYDNSLEPSTTYSYMVNCYDSYRDSPLTGPVSATTDASKTLKRPSSFAVKDLTAYCIRVSWTSVDGAVGYHIYRSTSEGGTYELVGDVTDETYFLDDELDPNTRYYYKMAAYNLKVEGDMTKVKYDTTKDGSYLKKPSSLRATALDESRVTITWKAATGAVGYRVYRAATSKGNYEEIADVTILSYVDTGLNAYTKYYYKVEAYDKYSTGPRTSYYSVRTKKPIVLKKPAGLVVRTVDYHTLGVKFAYVTGATNYDIYISTSENGSYELIGSTDGAKEHLIDGLLPGTTYYVKVEANNENQISPMAGPRKAKTKEVDPLKKPSTFSVRDLTFDSMRLSWKQVPGATGYRVYRSNARDGVFEHIGDTQDYFYIDTGLKADTRYYYYVEGYNHLTTGLPTSIVGETTRRS